jgi:hypothetical protein
METPHDVFRQVVAETGNRIAGIRAVRERFGLDLRQAKEVMHQTEGTPLTEQEERMATAVAGAFLESDFIWWLRRICSTEIPPDSIIAYNIGLFETAEGYSAYLVGAEHYDEEDSDWACEQAFKPQEQYFPFSADGLGNWEAVQAAVLVATRAFLMSPDGAMSFLAKAQAVTVGFDDGDLERIK